MRLRDSFNQIVDGPPILKKVVPPVQRAVKKLIDFGSRNDGIRRIIIFGSATSWDFTSVSDLDVCIDSDEPEERILKCLSSLISGDIEFDLVLWKDASALFKSEIGKGVVVYERSCDSGTA